MKTQTNAQAAQAASQESENFDALWDQVDFVERLSDGSDLYTYPDGSQLKVTASSLVMI